MPVYALLCFSARLRQTLGQALPLALPALAERGAGLRPQKGDQALEALLHL